MTENSYGFWMEPHGTMDSKTTILAVHQFRKNGRQKFFQTKSLPYSNLTIFHRNFQEILSLKAFQGNFI